MAYYDLVDTFQALSDPNRRKIIELIALRGKLSATDISDKFKISSPAISQHLKVLRETKIVDMEKRAQQRLYTINTRSLQQIGSWVAKMNRLWNKRYDRLEKLLKSQGK